MNCSVCGAKVQGDEQICANCNEIESKVQILTLEEQQGFKGVTLEQDENGQDYRGYEKSHANQQIYIKQFNMGNINWLTKLVIGIVLAVLVVIALPIALFFISIVGLFLYIVRK
ncbi:hypothetical protein [Pelosinus sp. sgz500959]|uniref:hypothetical protein n=1 Tax=Pelosinus sp. sgz500959 TaxID=3242472 RepID=UPI003671A167